VGHHGQVIVFFSLKEIAEKYNQYKKLNK
jgi:hypothetical protein